MASAPSIMIVDDDPVLRLAAGEVLRQQGYTVREAEDGTEALSRLREAGVDLVIVDMLMPHKEGVETIREVKAAWPATRVLAISGGGQHLRSTQVLSLATMVGADATFEKPLRPAAFLEAVQALLADDGRAAARA